MTKSNTWPQVKHYFIINCKIQCTKQSLDTPKYKTIFTLITKSTSPVNKWAAQVQPKKKYIYIYDWWMNFEFDNLWPEMNWGTVDLLKASTLA